MDRKDTFKELRRRRKDPIRIPKKRVCFECERPTWGLHHVVPVSLGGTKQIPLCEVCHGKIHGELIFGSSLIKAGMARAKARGVVFGVKKKVTKDQHLKILDLRKDGASFRKIAETVGLSTGTVHRYISIGID